MYRSPDRQGHEEFTESGAGGLAVGCVVIIGIVPAGAMIHRVHVHFGLGPAAAVVAAVVALLAVLYVHFSVEAKVTIDERSMRLSRRRIALGYRGPERVEWEIPIEALDRARELKSHRPSKNGGWSTSVKLQLPQGRTIDAITLGGDGSDTTAYRQLTASLRHRLGPAFETEDDFGPMTEVMKKMFAEKHARRD